MKNLKLAAGPMGSQYSIANDNKNNNMLNPPNYRTYGPAPQSRISTTLVSSLVKLIVTQIKWIMCIDILFYVFSQIKIVIRGRRLSIKVVKQLYRSSS